MHKYIGVLGSGKLFIANLKVYIVVVQCSFIYISLKYIGISKYFCMYALFNKNSSLEVDVSFLVTDPCGIFPRCTAGEDEEAQDNYR